MSTFDGLKRSLNIAGSKIVVVTEEKIYSQFDLITGEVIVTAPEYKQAGNSIKLELKEFWTETRSRGKGIIETVTVHKTHAEVALHGYFDFEPKSQHVFPFEVHLPGNCRISTESTGWCLAITMEIPKAIDPTERIVLKVQPAKEFLAIIKVCEKSLGFQERQKSRNWNARSSKTCFRLMPPEVRNFKSELDYMALDLTQAEDGGVEGNLIFNLQEKSITDYLRAIIGKDKIKRHFRIASSQLFSRDGDVNSGYITEIIGGSLKEVIEKRTQ